MFRFPEFPSGQYLHDASLIHDGSPMAHLIDQGQVMADENDGQLRLPLNGEKQIDDLLLHRHIEGTGRLVADEDLGL